MGNQSNLGVCPLWALIALNSPNLPMYFQDLPIPENEGQDCSLVYANCKGSSCQLWDSQRGDCGLKHPSVAPAAQEPSEKSETKILLGFHTDDSPFPSEPE